jgi:hypothetical protein
MRLRQRYSPSSDALASDTVASHIVGSTALAEPATVETSERSGRRRRSGRFARQFTGQFTRWLPINPDISLAGARSSRTVTVGHGSMLGLIALFALVVVWGAGASFLLIFGDRMSGRLITQTSEMQEAYEQRLQASRAEVARLTFEIEQSRFDETSVEGRVIEMGRRQRLIEARLQTLKRITELAGNSGQPVSPSLTPVLPTNPIRQEGDHPPLFPLPDILEKEHSPDGIVPHVQPIQFLDAPPLESPSEWINPEIERFLEQMDGVLKKTEISVMSLLMDMRRLSEDTISRIRSGLNIIGLNPEQATLRQGREGNDRGAYTTSQVILPVSEEKTPFGLGIRQIQKDFMIMHKMWPIMESLPLTRPTDAQIRYSSGFGFRMDPFKGIHKFHAGLDVAGSSGMIIRAAGSGIVIRAGWSGNYGNLVIIDHGAGLTTRYAHLSEILVSPQQPIARGATLGRMGSTGSSTAPHLHFETRINGNAVNPACFILAGHQIFGNQPVRFTCDQPPIWGKTVREEDEDEDSDSWTPAKTLALWLDE